MTEQIFKELPKMHTTYANVIKSLIPHSEHKDVALPDLVYRVEQLGIDESNLRQYREICGFVDDGRVPATYFAVLSQTLQMNMMATPKFPFVMLGLVHIENSVTQYQPIFDTQSVSMSVRLDNLTSHDKGWQFDFITQVHIGDELVWEGVSTYLARQKKPRTQKTKSAPKTVITKPDASECLNVMDIDVPEDIGRRYAFVSGDFNLIHLHPLSARAFGFPKAIAHGMWSKARCLASLGQLPKAYRVDVSFKLPVFLPSCVELMMQGKTGEQSFYLFAKNSDKLHLSGVLTQL